MLCKYPMLPALLYVHFTHYQLKSTAKCFFFLNILKISLKFSLIFILYFNEYVILVVLSIYLTQPRITWEGSLVEMCIRLVRVHVWDSLSRLLTSVERTSHSGQHLSLVSVLNMWDRRKLVESKEAGSCVFILSQLLTVDWLADWVSVLISLSNEVQPRLLSEMNPFSSEFLCYLIIVIERKLENIPIFLLILSITVSKDEPHTKTLTIVIYKLHF